MPSKQTLKFQVRWLWEHWRPYRAEVPLLLLLTVLNACLVLVYPYLLKRIVDGLATSLSTAYILRHVAVLLGVGVALFVVYALMQTLRARLNMRFEYGVRVRIFEHLLGMGPKFFSRFRTGDVVTRMTDDINEKLAWYMSSGIFRVLEAGLVIVFGIAMMLWINPKLTLWAAGPLPILIGIFVVSADRLHRRYDQVQTAISQLNNSLESCFSGIRVVKAYAAEDSQRRVIEQAIEEQRRAEIRAVRWQTVIDSLYGNIWQLGIVGVLLVGGAMATRGEITLGDLIAFDAYVLLLVWPMFDVGQFFVHGKRSAVVIDRVSELENTKPELADGPVALPVARRPEDPNVGQNGKPSTPYGPVSLRLEHVCYRYPQGLVDALQDVSGSIEPGSWNAVVGEIGSGKSTLLALVCRLMDPARGKVLLNNLDLVDWDPASLANAIGYIPQEAQLLSGTVRENIRFGRSFITEDDVSRAAHWACLDDDLSKWKDGLDRVVGHRGQQLSGGQKQRVALARAFAGRPSLLLLDDCSASLDSKTETLVWQRIRKELPQVSVLFVTHRPALLQKADQILLLDKGRLHAAGDFRQLNRDGSLFHQLYVQWEAMQQIEET